MQDGAAVAEPVVAMVDTIEVEAKASADGVDIVWRPLGPSEADSHPRFFLEGVSARQRASDYGGVSQLMFALGGTDAGIARQLDLVSGLGQAGMNAGSDVLIARLSPQFEVLARVDNDEALVAALNAVADDVTPSADTQRTLPMAFQFAIDSPGRTAIVAPANAFPVEEDVLVGIVSAATARDIYLFPVTAEPEHLALEPFANVTGGRLVPSASDTNSGDLLSDYLGGGSVSFELPAHRRYRLPGEPSKPLSLGVETGGLNESLPLPRQTPELTWTQVAIRAVQPAHWGGWLASPGRRSIGAIGLASNILLIGLIGLLTRRVMTAQPKPETPGHRTVATPEVTLAPLRKTIGRKSDCDFVLNDSTVSRLHALLFQTGEQMWIEDENSTNGLFIFQEGEWVQTEKSPLQIGDRLKFGDCVVSVEELVRAVDLVPPGPVGTQSEASDLARFNKPRRNPYTGKIEEGA
ncbi:MAG: FHA domain-containing protein [Pseudomonadota bacterium]